MTCCSLALQKQQHAIQQRIRQLREKRVALCHFIQTTQVPQKYIDAALFDLEEVSSTISKYKTKLELISTCADECDVDYLTTDTVEVTKEYE